MDERRDILKVGVSELQFDDDLSRALAKGGILTKREILERLKPPEPLIRGYIDLASQLQPAGFELTVGEVGRFEGRGVLDSTNTNRRLPSLSRMELGEGERLELNAGAYLVRYNEVVCLPLDLLALLFPRSSLLRSGATIYTAVWEPGYVGRGQGLLLVHNPWGLELFKNARIGQLVFMRLQEPVSEGYSGAYMGEGLQGGESR